ncbi:OmpP1/FadL family transporter [Marinifilum sp. D737]|uniref:OmpP1/FadL family transporter n=1 Tax=Marinifilum sp. D737 TaxID=2969628 RepID=UPI0022730F84|nr:OmpP1/FadL family transporter [Marinifilum sp. D737]MCY1635422.1 OmpP1/FadL family transporter [Marinifilum sp. D737]
MIKRICLAIAIIAMAYNVKAEGFAVNLQGVKQTGMGHVGTALNFDASSMQWNPGALATLDSKYSFSLGGFGTLTKAEYTGLNGTESTDNPTNTPFYFYGSMKVSDKFAVGLGVYTPFGNTMDWGETWSGRYLIQDISMKGIYIQPTVSYKINDWLSVGAGLNIVYGDVELNRAVNVGPLVGSPTPVDGSVEISGNNIQYGYNLGVFIQPNDKLNIGISYRSQVDVDLSYSDATADFTVIDPVSPLFPDGGVAASLPLPASFNLGFAYQINDKWLVSADVNFIKWSEYKSLDFDFETNTTTTVNTPGGPMTIPVLTDSESTRDWDNSMTWRFGTRYTANEKLDLYAGLYFDQTPTNDKYYTPETPGANKVGISLGFSYKLTDKLSLDATVLYNEGEKVDRIDSNSGFEGEYKYKAWLPGVGITYNF